MAAQHKVEDVTSGGDRVKLILAILVVVAGVVGFYLLRDQALIFRVLSVIGGLVLGGLIAWTSTQGRRLLAFLRESWQETRRANVGMWCTPTRAWRRASAVPFVSASSVQACRISSARFSFPPKKWWR